MVANALKGSKAPRTAAPIRGARRRLPPRAPGAARRGWRERKGQSWASLIPSQHVAGGGLAEGSEKVLSRLGGTDVAFGLAANERDTN